MSQFDVFEVWFVQDLCWFDLFVLLWVLLCEVDGVCVFDVVIVGGGMVGFVVFVELCLFGIDNQCVIDCVLVGYEGLWVMFVWMEMLCLFKQFVGFVFGLFVLMFCVWFEV